MQYCPPAAYFIIKEIRVKFKFLFKSKFLGFVEAPVGVLLTFYYQLKNQKTYFFLYISMSCISDRLVLDTLIFHMFYIHISILQPFCLTYPWVVSLIEKHCYTMYPCQPSAGQQVWGELIQKIEGVGLVIRRKY